MKIALRVIIWAIVIAILSVALSFLGEINLVWIICLALFAVGDEDFAVLLGLAGGFLLDLLLHRSIGMTSLALGFALLVGILINGLTSIPKWSKAMLVLLLGSFFVVLASSVASTIIETGNVFPSSYGQYFVMRGLGNFVLCLIAFGVITFWKSQNPGGKVVKI